MLIILVSFSFSHPSLILSQSLDIIGNTTIPSIVGVLCTIKCYFTKFHCIALKISFGDIQVNFQLL